MAFRNVKFIPSFEPSCEVMDEVLVTDIVDGVAISSLKFVKASELAKALPKYEDYKLSALLASGVPLTPVDPVIFKSPFVDAASVVANLPVGENEATNVENENTNV